MNLFHKSYTLLTLILAALCFGCTDEILSPDSPNQPEDSAFVAVDLPGCFAINLSQNENVNTRAQAFMDGIGPEYELGISTASDQLHYLLLYKTTNANSKPYIFPIDVTQKVNDPNQNNNLTLTISKVYVNGIDGRINGSDELAGFNSLAALKEGLSNMQAYVLLNFKLADSGYGENKSEPNYVSPVEFSENSSTVDKLSQLTSAQLESLQMRDYKSTVTQNGVNRSFFIMSNSVYSNGTSKIIHGALDTSKIFTSEEQAKNNPAIEVCVERLAVRVSVSFNTASMGVANFDPYGNQRILSVERDPSTGLPVMHLVVDKVNMDRDANGSGITFDSQEGYHINTQEMNATLRIIGYSLSNLENSTRLVKNINTIYSTSWDWNDATNHRSYWSNEFSDTHYQLTKPGSNPTFTRAIGYPHQFRQALDTDSVTSYHAGPDAGGYTYAGNEQDQYEVAGETYTAYNQLGEINLSKIINGVHLKYKSFESLMTEFRNLGRSSSTVGGVTTYTYDPMYTLENTYYDQGMFSSNFETWTWPWQRVPYGVATNLIVMAEIVIEEPYIAPTEGTETGKDGTSGKGSKSLNFSTREGEATSTTPATVYLGQNNIFYVRKVNLLKSKLTILNNVMLSGGNAGIQVLHGQWDQHKRYADNESMSFDDDDSPYLDKIAWYEGSVLWFAEVEMDNNGKPVYNSTTDKDGKTIYKAQLANKWQVNIDRTKDDAEIQDLDLIPAEISGGDGQMLIAPSKNRMGMKYKYYLAPVKVVYEDGKAIETMDEEHAVEISYNHLVALIHKIIGPVDVYTDGKMYFSVPIPHRISSYNNSRNNASWATFGAFSTVRNNWYNVQVTQITHLGTPVQDLNQPIVPVMDVKRSYINMGVELLNWHEVNEDNIPIM